MFDAAKQLKSTLTPTAKEGAQKSNGWALGTLPTATYFCKKDGRHGWGIAIVDGLLAKKQQKKPE